MTVISIRRPPRRSSAIRGAVKGEPLTRETASKTDEKRFSITHNASSAPWSPPPSLQRSISLALLLSSGTREFLPLPPAAIQHVRAARRCRSTGLPAARTRASRACRSRASRACCSGASRARAAYGSGASRAHAAYGSRAGSACRVCRAQSGVHVIQDPSC